MSTPQEQAQAIRLGLANVKDPVEQRNLRYAEAERLFNETKDPVYEKIMREINPSPKLNALRGAAIGAAEGAVTPWVVRDLIGSYIPALRDPGVPTTGNQAARVGGNLVGAIGGLGKATAMLGGLKAAPRAIAGLFGMTGVGQALGNRSEMEHQKEAQREYLGGMNAEIPSYAQPTPLSDPKAVANVVGQATLSALSGGLGQKATAAGKLLTLPSATAQIGEAIGSTGLMLNDSMGGPRGMGDAWRDNPEGMQDMLMLTGGMAAGGTFIPPGVSHMLNNRKAKAIASHNTASAPAPKPSAVPIDADSRTFTVSNSGLDENTLRSLQVAHMQRIAGLGDAQGQKSLGMSVVDPSEGAFFAVDPETQLQRQLVAMQRPDDFMNTGGSPALGSWILRGEDGQHQSTLNTLTNPMDLIYQRMGGSAYPMPKGAHPRANPNEVEFESGGQMLKGKILAEAPNGLVIWDGQKPVLVPEGSVRMPDTAALAPKNDSAIPRPGRLNPLPSANQFPEIMGNVYKRMTGLEAQIQQAIQEAEAAIPKAAVSHEPTVQGGFSFDDPSLPFNFDEILKAREWKMGPGFPMRKQ